MRFDRQTVRYMGASFAALMAGVYFLVGLNVLYIGTTTEGTTDQFGFGMAAGLAFLAWAVLLVLTYKRWLWVIGLAFHALVFIVYIGASGIRVPPFETWGITLRLIHVPLLLALLYLSLRAPRRSATAPGSRDPGGRLPLSVR